MEKSSLKLLFDILNTLTETRLPDIRGGKVNIAYQLMVLQLCYLH